MLGSFGEKIIFECSADLIRTFDNLSISASAKYAEHARINKKSLLEFVGINLIDISFKMLLMQEIGLNVLDEIKVLREMRDNGEAELLIIGGEILGKFVIIDLKEDWQIINNKGELKKASLDIKLKEYIDYNELVKK